MIVDLRVDNLSNYDHPRLGPILVAALKARLIEPETDAFIEIASMRVEIRQVGAAVSIQAHSLAHAHEAALDAVKLVFDAAMVDGYEAWIKTVPNSLEHKDFERESVTHRGYTRFLLLPTKGPQELRGPFAVMDPRARLHAPQD